MPIACPECSEYSTGENPSMRCPGTGVYFCKRCGRQVREKEPRQYMLCQCCRRDMGHEGDYCQNCGKVIKPMTGWKRFWWMLRNLGQDPNKETIL